MVIAFDIFDGTGANGLAGGDPALVRLDAELSSFGNLESGASTVLTQPTPDSSLVSDAETVTDVRTDDVTHTPRAPMVNGARENSDTRMERRDL